MRKYSSTVLIFYFYGIYSKMEIVLNYFNLSLQGKFIAIINENFHCEDFKILKDHSDKAQKGIRAIRENCFIF